MARTLKTVDAHAHLGGCCVFGITTTEEELIRLMKHDKKVLHGKINLILLRGIGSAVKTADVTDEEIMAVCCDMRMLTRV